MAGYSTRQYQRKGEVYKIKLYNFALIETWQTAAFGKIVKFVFLNWFKLTASSSVPSTAGSRSASTKFHWPGEKKDRIRGLVFTGYGG